MNTVASLITAKRLKANMTKTELAKAIGRSVTQVYHYENGKYLSYENIRRIADTLCFPKLMEYARKNSLKKVYCYDRTGKFVQLATYKEIEQTLLLNRKTVDSAIKKGHFVSNRYFFSQHPISDIKKVAKLQKRNRIIYQFDEERNLKGEGTVKEISAKFLLRAETINAAIRNKSMVGKVYYFSNTTVLRKKGSK